MNRSNFLLLGIVVILLPCCYAFTWDSVQLVMGLKGDLFEDDKLLRYDLVRTDLGGWISIGNKMVKPELGAVGFVTFFCKDDDKNCLLTGEIPLQDSSKELDPLVETIINFNNNVENTKLNVGAIVNHLKGDNPKLVWVHLEGKGKVVDMAKCVKSLLGLAKDPQNNLPVKNRNIEKMIDVAKLKQIVGSENDKIIGSVLRLEVPRKIDFSILGEKKVPVMLGAASMFFFEPKSLIFHSGLDKVIGLCEFAVKEKEVSKVLTQLENNGFSVAALHTHFVTAKPGLFFIHAEIEGESEKVAESIKDVLDLLE